jgi:branched-chain amino acid transport system ATP-binding protein
VSTGTEEARRRADELLEQLGITPLADRLAGTLPHGDESKVGVARALASRPHYVLMDEPAAGLPEAEVGSLVDAIRSVRDRFQAGVLVVDHNMALIMEVSDRIQVLDHGRTLAEGAPAEIRRNIDVAAAYLGSSGVSEEPADG